MAEESVGGGRERQRPGRGQEQPGHRDRTRTDAVGEAAGRPGRQGADTLGRERQPGADHALVAHLLEQSVSRKHPAVRGRPAREGRCAQTSCPGA
ncbi:hypothetical protein [Streptomyces sp. NRRL S-646]|uniref:hypothetical protein n=1 Tax=Streptomyces sp. NRRL S-646 TaxID=1463917 RepID=UPI0004CA084D|nr:hypothetical protein [Streptomyces sp. NRRL S-646]